MPAAEEGAALRFTARFGSCRSGGAAPLNASQVPRFHHTVTERREADEQRARKPCEPRRGSFDEDAVVIKRGLCAPAIELVR
jgi:hypothetical protein